MSALMLCLETFPTDIERVELIAKSELETWAREQEGGEKLNLSLDVKFCERLNPLTWVGGSKDVKVRFSDKSHTEANFVVVKKRLVRSLQDLAAESVASNLKSFSSVSTFQLPILLRMTVKKWYFDHWNQRFFNRKMYHYFKTKEVARRVNVLNDKNVRSSDRKSVIKPRGHAKKQAVNLKSLKECPVCEKNNLKNVRLHMARSKECKKKMQVEY